MTKPTIHLNGTSAKELADGYQMAYRAVDNACEAVSLYASPNGRDYYPQDAGAHRKAIDENRDRLAKLKDIREELLELWEHCQNHVKE